MLEQPLVVRRHLRLGEDAVGSLDGDVDLVITAQAQRNAGHDAWRRAACRLGGLSEGRRDVVADGAFVRHPQDRSVRSCACEPQHHRTQRGQHHGRRPDVGDVERVVHSEHVVLDIDRPRTGQRPVEDVEMSPHRGHRTFVGQAEHLLDDPVVRDPQPEGEAPFTRRLCRQDLLRERDRVPRLHRHDRGTDLDPGGLDTDEGGGREGVEVIGDLGDPDGRQPRFLRPPGIGAEPLDLRPVPPSLRPHHHADPHRALLRLRMAFLHEHNVDSKAMNVG